MGQRRLHLIDARDIARLPVKALTEPGLENKAFRLATASHTLAEIECLSGWACAEKASHQNKKTPCARR